MKRAEEVLRSALASAERMGLIDVRAIILHNLGRVVGVGGDLAEAERLERAALEQLERQGEPRLQGLARTYLATILIAANKPEEAVVQARGALSTLDAAPALRAVASSTLASALAATGRSAEALDAARLAHSELEALGFVEEGEAEIRLGYARALAGVGASMEARAAIADARTRLLERATKIADPVWRERFLHDVPVNARTLEFAECWSKPMDRALNAEDLL
jgi:eukaryotic-like serine/threonine-protein kinase